MLGIWSCIHINLLIFSSNLQGVFKTVEQQLDVRSLRSEDTPSSLEHMETDIFILGK